VGAAAVALTVLAVACGAATSARGESIAGIWGVVASPLAASSASSQRLAQLRAKGVNTIVFDARPLVRSQVGIGRIAAVAAHVRLADLDAVAMVPAAGKAPPLCVTQRGVRCAATAPSVPAAARLARVADVLRPLVAVRVGSFAQLAQLAQLPRERRRILALAPLTAHADAEGDTDAWQSGIALAQASAGLDLGVSPDDGFDSPVLDGFLDVLVGPTRHVCVGRSFYVDYGSGSDSNAGTSKASPWKRAPGMRRFAGAYSPQAHDCFYFKGGVTWPNSVFPLVPSRGGDALGNVYYGPDPGWHVGTRWSRPVFDAQRTAIDGGHRDIFVDLSDADYTTIDNIDFTGWTAADQAYGTCAVIFLVGSTHIVIDHVYVHGFSIGPASDTNCMAVQAATYGEFGGSSVVRNSVFEGNGASYGEAIRCVSNVRNTVIHDMVGMIFPCGRGEIANNTLYNCGYPSFPAGASGVHADAIQPTAANGSLYIHDNVIHDTGADSNGNECETMLIGNAGETDYVWNNVIYNVHGNAVALTQDASAGTAAYIWNNTITGGQDGKGYCVREGHASLWQKISIQNNHCITSAGRIDDPALAAGEKIVDHNVTQSPRQASSQGYVRAGTYVYWPRSARSATIDAGADLTGNCSGPTIGLCRSTTYGAQPSGLLVRARPRGSAWDAGAYQR
jgi:hypothetical protein